MICKMVLPGNGIYVVRGEMSALTTSIRRSLGWHTTSEEADTLLRPFITLKQVLNRVDDLRLIGPKMFLEPFLEVIQMHKITSAVTCLALASINKFLSYGLIDPTTPDLAGIIELIVKAVTEARFMATDQSANGVTFLRAVEVLRTLMRSPEGSMLSHGLVIQVMHRCFRICKSGPNELLRRTAEHALRDMILLFFMRLPQFSEDHNESGHQNAELEKKPWRKSSKVHEPEQIEMKSNPFLESSAQSSSDCEPATRIMKEMPLETTPARNILGVDEQISQATAAAVSLKELHTTPVLEVNNASIVSAIENDSYHQKNKTLANSRDVAGSNEYINSVGVRFTQQESIEAIENAAFQQSPYGLPFMEYLFGYLTSLCNPHDKANTDSDIHIGLSLITIAFEVGADSIGKYDSLLKIVKDDLCKNLIALLSSERLTIIAADLGLSFLIFVSLRGYLKLQLELYLRKISEIISNDNPKAQYEARELALENLLQLWRIPGFVTELYVNYDCDLYCSDVFENLTKLLSQHVNSATNTIYSTHVLAIDTLISVIDNIDINCNELKTSSCMSGKDAATIQVESTDQWQHNSDLEGIELDASSDRDKRIVVEDFSKFMSISEKRESTNATKIPHEHLARLKKTKCILTKGTAKFNDQSPSSGIKYLQEKGYLNAELDTMEVAQFLRQNPGLSKKVIGEYISKRNEVNSEILKSFVQSFDFTGLRIDQALRLFLETFRLPGEAPVISLILEHFADHWRKQNGEQFANVDAAYVLAYAVIMLNTDHHNCNAQRVNVPMTLEQFLKNLRGVNGSNDFDQLMLTEIYEAVSNEEIILPSEQTGLVRENYLWKVLLRRSIGPDGVYNFVHDAAYDTEIFNIVWDALLPALSLMFDRSNELVCQRTLASFAKCAAICAHYNLYKEFDALILALCSFTSLLNTMPEDTPIAAYNDIALAVNFGLNIKGKAAIRTIFILVHNYADCLRESWAKILDLILQLFRLKLLPRSFMEVEDFCELKGKAQLIVEKPRERQQEAGLFSSLYSYLAPEGQREPTIEEQECIKIGKKCIKDCQLEQFLQESKFVQEASLQGLIQCLLTFIKPPAAHKSINLPYPEDVVVFWMEFLVKIVVYNRDRIIPLWTNVRDQLYLLLIGSASCDYEYLLHRCIVAILKIAIDLMRNEKLCPVLLYSLKMLLKLKPAVILRISVQISIGMYELLKTSAQNIHSEQDWKIIFLILESVGGGATPPHFDDVVLPIPSTGSASTTDGATSSEEDIVKLSRGYSSDPDLSSSLLKTALNGGSSPVTDNWTFLSGDSEISPTISRPQSPQNGCDKSTLVFNCRLLNHMPFALLKCYDSLAFIVRNVAHITPYNFESCVHCIRTFVEVCRDGSYWQRCRYDDGRASELRSNQTNAKKSIKRLERDSNYAASVATNGHEAEDEEIALMYEKLSKDLLDLMYTLHTRTGQIFRWWAEESSAVPQCSALWAQGFCPLLQGIARFAMDRRRNVRTHAIACLQRALLVQELQNLTGAEWSLCFRHVLFPLSNELLPESASIKNLDALLLEESRIRIAAIMSKVFLHHLTPLIELNEGFNELWIELLNVIDKFMKVGSDMLSEQMLEILKNMLLVMHSVQIFETPNGHLWQLTWQRIDEFLPNLRQEIFRDEGKRTVSSDTKDPQATEDTTSSLRPVAIADVPVVAIVSPAKPMETAKVEVVPCHGSVVSPESTLSIVPVLDLEAERDVSTHSPFLPQQGAQIQPVTTLTEITENAANIGAAMTNTPNTQDNSFTSDKVRKETTNDPYAFAIEIPQNEARHGDQLQINDLSNAALVREEYTKLYANQTTNTSTSTTITDATIHKIEVNICSQFSAVPNEMPTQAIAQCSAPILLPADIARAGMDRHYVPNPYKLTLHTAVEQRQETRELAPTSHVFTGVNTPKNYFNRNIDPKEIPPGSELLYGQH